MAANEGGTAGVTPSFHRGRGFSFFMEVMTVRMSHLLFKTERAVSSDAMLPSHGLLLRAGLIKQVSAGIYSLTPLAQRVVQRISALVREEMNGLDGQEVLLPVAQPASLWEESGRYETIDASMARWSDRNGQAMVLAMTHEEAVTDLVRHAVQSWRQLPLMVYQVQTKFRDEARPRGGLVRLREFLMKDAYSFHANRDSLDDFYERMATAYDTFFRRCGITALKVESDTGMMGGGMAHEFMVLAAGGEDTLIVCPGCQYAANQEVAVFRSVIHGQVCVHCGSLLQAVRGIEVGNIFKLGTKYSEPMRATFADSDGSLQPMIMGCYGIGISRVLACIIEANHDDLGIVWPASVAPYDAHLVVLGDQDDVRTAADGLYQQLGASRVLYDDRDATAGVKLTDADLLGLPLRITVSRRSLAAGGAELKVRRSGETRVVTLADVEQALTQLVHP